MTSSSEFSKVDEYGFKRPENFDYEQYESFMSSYYIILTNRSKKWYNLIKDGKRLKRGPLLKRYIKKGIPSAYRSEVWLQISGADDLKLKYGSDLYSKRLNTILDSEIVHSIRTDLPRTFPENIYFVPLEGYQEQLYRVLFAFAADNSKVGYCQGLNYIGGLLLLVTKNEDTTFWLLKTLVETILPDYYTHNMRGLMIDIEIFSRIVQTRMPDLYSHIKALNVPWSCLVMKWFVCLYAEVLPTETVLRVWDCVFYERTKTLFRVGICLLKYHRKALLECDGFTSFMECFKKVPQGSFVLDCHNFINRVNKDCKFITNSELQKLRKQINIVKGKVV